MHAAEFGGPVQCQFAEARISPEELPAVGRRLAEPREQGLAANSP